MVGATDTVFFAAVTVVSDVGTMVFFTQTLVPVPETMVLLEREDLLDREDHFPGRKEDGLGL